MQVLSGRVMIKDNVNITPVPLSICDSHYYVLMSSTSWYPGKPASILHIFYIWRAKFWLGFFPPIFFLFLKLIQFLNKKIFDV